MKLYLMQLATLQPGNIPVPAYLVQTDDGANILIDSGFPLDFVANAPELEGGLRIEMSEDNFIVNRLSSIGLQPSDIHFLVCTHLDADHAGGHRAFTDAELIVQRSHYEVARQSDLPRFAALREHWNYDALRYRLVEGDLELVRGVELIETSGHVPGHQAVLVRLPETGAVLLTIDAIPHSSMIDSETRPIHPMDMDEIGTRASTRKLMELAHRENAALIIYGHDSEQWANLKHAPEFYS
ncbi:MAG: N-acyl homoserine lactonase family protein [Pyrinomonadaceae bacterium]|nr:N-acyl homoserine lactonase family protein [Pyrinomonadaceae bacterium]